jgi:hypothetical protein
MNERIRVLAEQAGLEFDDDLALEPEPIYYITQKELERFAQLIVRECLQICKDVGIESKDYQEGRQMGAEVCHNMIKKHFEVE